MEFYDVSLTMPTTKQSLVKALVHLTDVFCDTDNLNYKVVFKCPVCKLNTDSTSEYCIHCKYEFSELEKKEQIQKYRAQYFRGLIFGLVLFAIIVFSVIKFY